MESMYYVGLDVHKKLISYCVKDASGRIHAQGKIAATRYDLDVWMKTLPGPWMAAMEATMFTGWIYDHLKPHAVALKVAHPLMPSLWQKRRMIGSMRTRSVTPCGVILTPAPVPGRAGPFAEDGRCVGAVTRARSLLGGTR
jgi:hypothetical protein